MKEILGDKKNLVIIALSILLAAAVIYIILLQKDITQIYYYLGQCSGQLELILKTLSTGAR